VSLIDNADDTAAVRVQRMPRWTTGRSELIVAAGVIGLAVALTVGIVTMEIPEGTAPPGPQFFPIIVAVFLYAVGTALAVTVIVSPARAHVVGDPTEVSTQMLGDLGALDRTAEIRVVAPEAIAVKAVSTRPGVDWRTVGITIAAIAVFIVILPIIGWLLSAAALFWILSWNFGSKRQLLDLGTAVIISSLIQLAFGAGLGLTLPAGILEGALSWIS
jgi:putative tricarboxylic transport membrane protein